MKHFAIALFALLSLAVSAQPCTPNPQYAGFPPGLYPDTIDIPFLTGNGYNPVVDVINDTITTIAGYNYVKAERLCLIDTLYPGEAVATEYFGIVGGYGATMNSGIFPNYSPAQWCFMIGLGEDHITDLLGGNFQVYAEVTAYIDKYVCDGSNNCIWLSQLGQQYCGEPHTITLHVYRTVGINETHANTFSVGESYPNPATCAVNIPFTSVKEEAVTIGIYSIWGVLVSQTTIQSKPGNNVGIVNTSALAAGWYMCQVSNGKETIYKRVIVE